MAVDVRDAEAKEALAEIAKKDEELTAENPAPPSRRFRSPGFIRMPVEWAPNDAAVKDRALRLTEERLQETFADAYALMHDVYLLVREPEVDANGEIRRDRYGWPVWQRTESGAWVEDFSRMTHHHRENFLFAITTRMFAWEQLAADAWGEAMFARGKWEERFSIAFRSPMDGTVGDRTAAGRVEASDERYFGMFCALYSRKAEALVRAMALLAQRIKDVMIG